MEGHRIRHRHLLTPPRNVGSTVSPKAELLPPHTPDFALLPVKAVPRASSRPPLHTPWASSVVHILPISCTHNISPQPSHCLGKAWCFPGLPGKDSQPSSPAGRSRTVTFQLSFPLTPSVPHHPTVGPYQLRTTLHPAPPHEDLLIVLKQSEHRERKRECLSVQPLHGTDSESTAYEH